MTVSPSPEQLGELAGNLHRLAKWCQAKDPNATIWLHAIEAADALESAQAEIVRLTTVSGDMVEEMARAICAIKGIEADRMEGPLRRPLWERQASIARVCASIAKGRMEALVRNAYEEGVEDGMEWGIDPSGEPKPGWIDSVARVELLKHTRAALKDSPNVG
jgi:hypothetical protein